MQLGTRWTSGDEPPKAVPESLRAEIRAVDLENVGQPRPRWTLTWLEGRPIAELDTGVFVSLGADGEVEVTHDPDDQFG